MSESQNDTNSVDDFNLSEASEVDLNPREMQLSFSRIDTSQDNLNA